MQRYWLPVEEQAAAAEEVITASMDDLGNYERNILRRARRNGQCPEGLDELLPGFQSLCGDAVAEGVGAHRRHQRGRRQMGRSASR